MNLTLIRIFALALSFQSLTAFGQVKSADHQSGNNPLPISPSVAPNGSSTPALAVATPATPAPLSDDEKKKLATEFKKALTQQRISMSHQERSAIRELISAQNQKQKRWREEQKRLRRQFFDQHMSGPERREYVQSYLKKKQEFENSLKSEVATTRKSWTEKQQNLKKTQKEMEEKFNQTISQGQRPAPELWPSGS